MRPIVAILGMLACAGCLPYPEDLGASGPDATQADASNNISNPDAGGSGDSGMDAASDSGGSTDAGADASDDMGSSTVWTQVTAGRAHACGLSSDGEVYCWGQREQGQFEAATNTVATPTLVDFGPGVVIKQISAHHGRATGQGGATTCAVDTADNLYCWGRNDNGIVRQDRVERASPQLLSANVDSVDVGVDHACVVRGTGEVQCWGANGVGQSADSLENPVVPIGGPAIGPNQVQKVVAGDRVTYAIVGSALWIWGDLEYHAVQCNAVCEVSLPTECSCPSLLNMSTISDLVAGSTHVCAIDDNVLVCWGENNLFQIGTAGIGSTPFVEAVQQFTPESELGEFALGLAHTCAEANADLYCWGNNQSDQLGPNTGETATGTPTPVGLSDIDSVAAGRSFTCAVSRGELYCWGDNTDRQLGRGDANSGDSYADPLPVETPWE